jgi:hypothetical protein
MKILAGPIRLLPAPRKEAELDIEVDLGRRNFMRVGATVGVGALVLGTTACPFSGVTKAKAVRVAGFIIDITKEALPLLDLLGAHDIAELVRIKAIPALEKLKDALANADIPTAGTTLGTVRNVLSGVANALLNLPDSPRRTTIIGILASINVLLLTVEAFIESEMPSGATTAAISAPKTGAKMLKVFQATRQ